MPCGQSPSSNSCMRVCRFCMCVLLKLEMRLLVFSFCLFPCTPTLHTDTLTGSCVHYSCEAIDCPEPLIRNADLRCSSPGRRFYNGDRCTISCHSGYVLQIHQDDDLIKSQVNTPLLYVCTHTPTCKEHTEMVEFLPAHVKIHGHAYGYMHLERRGEERQRKEKQSLWGE